MKMNHYALGVDIGIASVGYGVLDIETGKAVDYGVRLFEEGTAANNEKRRASRGARRLKRRKQNRLHDTRKLLEEYGLIEEDYHFHLNPYDARVKGLHEKLSNEELATAIYNLIKVRGSSLEAVEDDEKKAKEAGTTKAALAANDSEIAKGKFVCEIQRERMDVAGKIHGHENNFRTKNYIAEANQILANQDVPDSFKNEVIALISRRRDFSEGPGSQKSPTPYGRWIEADQETPIDLIEKMRGKCSVYPDEPRAAKMTYKADLFNLLNDLNNLTINDEKISQEQKEEVIEVIDKKGKITPKELAKLLGVEIEKISGFRVNGKNEPILTEFKGYKKIKDILTESNLYKNHEIVDEIIEELTKTKAVEEREKYFREHIEGLTDGEIERLSLESGVAGYHSLSAKAINELNHEMLVSECNQMQILSVTKSNQEHLERLKGRVNIKADSTAILSPVAIRSQNEAIKVINALRKKYGEFESIIIELPREKNGDDQKKRKKDTQAFFEKANKDAEKLLKENGGGVKLTSKLRTKLRLYEEQQGKTAYTLEPIDLGLLIHDPHAYEIDHILPISNSFNDAYSNKVLVSRFENQAKGNMTPIQAIRKQVFVDRGKDKNVSETVFKANVLHLKSTHGQKYDTKKQNLLYEGDLTKFENQERFIQRNLVDTSYASRVVLNTLQDFFKANEIPTWVTAVRGSSTSMFRKRIKLEKSREEDDKHHAVDALIIASFRLFPRFQSVLRKYAKSNELFYNPETGEVSEILSEKEFFDERYMKLVHDLMLIERDVTKFSYKVDTKPNRQIADETIYSTRITPEGELVVKKYKDIYGKDGITVGNDMLAGNDKKYLMFKNSPETYEYMRSICKKIYAEYEGDEKICAGGKFKVSPFSLYQQDYGERIRKPSKKNNGPEIVSMKYFDGQLGNHVCISDNYQLNSGKNVVILQISPYRTDFYYSKEKGYKFVTIRYSNVRYSKSLEKYVIDRNWYEDQKKLKKIDDTYDFLFSMHHNEILHYQTENENRYYRYVATNNDKDNRIEVNAIGFVEKDPKTGKKKQLMKSVGKKVILLEKYATDVLGNMYLVKDSELKLEFE